jgi:hypothetical protein
MTEAERIELLQKVLVEQWGVFSDCFILSHDPALQQKAFYAFDRRLRKIGVLPKA